MALFVGTRSISPRQALFFSWSKWHGYADAPSQVVVEINLRTRANAIKHFVVRRNECRAEWFNMEYP